jgi:hypothetical protein
MTPELTTTPTPSARGWRPRARGRRSGRPSSWMGTMASGKPQHGSLRVARPLRQAFAGAMRMATHRGVLPLPCVPGSDACSWQAGHRRRGSLSGARSTAVSLSLRNKTLSVLPRRPMLRLTDAVIRPPWWPPRMLPRTGSPLVRPAGCTRRPTGGVGTGDVSLWLTPTIGTGRARRIRTSICSPICPPFTCQQHLQYQGEVSPIWQTGGAISVARADARQMGRR